jgi:hypothetical protein
VGIKKHLFEDYPGGSGSLGDPMVGECIDDPLGFHLCMAL